MISETYSEVLPAPIRRLHRHADGFISFAVERDSEADESDFRPLVSIRASELDTIFPQFLPQLLRDSYVSVNADWRLRTFGDPRSPDYPPFGYPLHRTDKLRYLNAAFVDLDHYKLGMRAGAVIGALVDLQDAGILPYFSMLVRSGRGLWALWFICDPANSEQSAGAFVDRLDLYGRIQTALIERTLQLGADSAARDAARYVRLPGSWHTDGESTVQWMIQGTGDSAYVYTLEDLANRLHATPTRRHGREIIAHHVRNRRGWNALFAYRMRDFSVLRARRRGFSLGVRNNACKLYAWLLRCIGTPGPDVWGLVNALAAECHPKLSRSEAKAAVDYSKRMRTMRIPDRMISDWLGITRAEAEILEKLPPATCYRTPEEMAPRIGPMPRQVQREGIQARRAAIQEILSQTGTVPTVRAMAKLTAAQGFSGNPRTIYMDYLALGVTWDRTLKAREERADPLLFTACEIGKQDSGAVLLQDGGDQKSGVFHGAERAA